MKNKSILWMLAVVLLHGLPACKNQPEAPDTGKSPSATMKSSRTKLSLEKVVFLPYWVANAQFAGYYMGKESGIYEAYGIDLHIIPYQPFSTSTELLQTGDADFAALWLVNAIEAKASGIDLVNIAQFSTRSSLMLITKKKSGINNIADMDGKRAGIWSGYELQPRAFFSKYNLNVEIVPIGSTNNLFLNDGVDITNANWFDEYHSIINSGYNPDELNTFFFADYGLNFLEDGIYCLSEKRISNPGLCTRFVLATREGWIEAFNHPEKAIDIVVEYAHRDNLPVNRVHQQWMLDRYRDLYYGNAQTSTVLNEADYLFAARVLKQSGLIDSIPVFEKFYLPYDDTSIP